MKLYFYFLEEQYDKKPHIRIEECEVVETSAMYVPVEKFPIGYYGRCIIKSSIGILNEDFHDKLILSSKNDILAKKLFSDYIKNQIDVKNKEINKLKEKLSAVERMEKNNGTIK